MSDLSDLEFFALTVRHGGFSAASRATGIEKSRLSRRVTALEKRLGVSLLHRTTRTVVLTEAGEHFYRHCESTLESLRATYECLAQLQTEPAGTVRLSAPPLLAECFLAPIIPTYLRAHPKVMVEIETRDGPVDLMAERLDIALLGIQPGSASEPSGLVIRQLGESAPMLVASPDLLARHGQPRQIEDLGLLPTLCRPEDVSQGAAHWELFRGATAVRVRHVPALVTRNIRVQLEAAIQGTGVALIHGPVARSAIRQGLLTRLLPEWSGQTSRLGLAYLSPRGMLPSVRSLIDHMLRGLPDLLEQDFFAQGGL
ncbi:MAG TPA: LysR substrate-binding domain-containing protein [Pseudomonas sp.]|nr:LysR substrate-binding domain-containing protein [Pseudomonas sp.]